MNTTPWRRRTPMERMTEAARIHAQTEREPTGATPMTLKEALKAHDEGIISAEKLRERWEMEPRTGTGRVLPGKSGPWPPVHLAPSPTARSVCGATFEPGYTCSSRRTETTCPDCLRMTVAPTPAATAAMGGVTGGSGTSWSDLEDEAVFDDHPVLVTAEQIDPEIIGKISMIDTIDEHLTVTADRLDEMAENLKALQKAMEGLQEAAPAPTTAASPPVAPTPSSDLREDILSILEEFGHDPEVAAEIIAERCRAEAPEDAPGLAALPERTPAITKATDAAMTVEDRLTVKEAIEREHYEVTPEGHLRVTAPQLDSEPLEWIFTEEGWRWTDGTSLVEVDEAGLAEALWRSNLEAGAGGGRGSTPPLTSVSEGTQNRYRDFAKRITAIMQDPDETFLR